MYYNIYIHFPLEEIYSTFNVAARRKDLPKTFHSLSFALEEAKDLIETHNSEQSGSENSSESVQRVSLPSLSLPQTQTSNQQRVMQNFRSLFAPYVAGASPCRPPQWPSPAATRSKGTEYPPAGELISVQP